MYDFKMPKVALNDSFDTVRYFLSQYKLPQYKVRSKCTEFLERKLICPNLAACDVMAVITHSFFRKRQSEKTIATKTRLKS